MKYLLCVFLLSINFVHAQNLVVSQPDQMFDDFTVEMYEDTSTSLTLGEVRKKSAFFTISNRISTGYSKSAFWFKFTLENRTDRPIKYFILSTEAFAHELDCYTISNTNQIVTFKEGVGRSDTNGIVHNRYGKFPIILKQDEKQEIYIRQYGLFPNYTSFNVMNESSLDAYMSTHDKFMAMYLGAALALILYNFFIYLYIKDIAYLLYVLYVTSFALWQTGLNGFAPFETASSSAEYYLTGSFIPLWIAFLILFSRKILDTVNTCPKTDKILLYTSYIYFILIIYSWFELHLAFVVINGLASLILPFLLFTGYRSYKAGNKTAKFYILAQVSLLSMSTIFSLMTDGVLEYNLVTRHGIVVGSFLEIMLFSLALGYKLRILQNEKIQVIKKAKNELEFKVKERTAELQKITVTDSLTSVLNRLGIDNAFENELERFKRYERPFSIILLDIDFFKKVNDVFGHQIGDSVLKELAALLLKNIRKSDMVGRWGGEEFIIFCPETTLKDAVNVAELMRTSIEKYVFEGAQHITVSLGVEMAQAKDTQDSMVKRVDDNLYKAKSNGRNCIYSND